MSNSCGCNNRNNITSPIVENITSGNSNVIPVVSSGLPGADGSDAAYMHITKETFLALRNATQADIIDNISSLVSKCSFYIGNTKILTPVQLVITTAGLSCSVSGPDANGDVTINLNSILSTITDGTITVQLTYNGITLTKVIEVVVIVQTPSTTQGTNQSTSQTYSGNISLCPTSKQIYNTTAQAVLAQAHQVPQILIPLFGQ